MVFSEIRDCKLAHSIPRPKAEENLQIARPTPRDDLFRSLEHLDLLRADVFGRLRTKYQSEAHNGSAIRTGRVFAGRRSRAAPGLIIRLTHWAVASSTGIDARSCFAIISNRLPRFTAGPNTPTFACYIGPIRPTLPPTPLSHMFVMR